ncbi:MAG: serine protease, partial [Sphingobacteriia bacterium]|nr:serine protease [Sphingobacteriia bacterium]
MKKIIISIAFLIFAQSFMRADEGMWIPMLLKKQNEKEMQANGMRISADDIYNINNASLKDAIVLFGRGCTGEIVSDKGLLLTNHHCGYGNIQQHSSLEFNYLEKGFWAMSLEEELPNKGLTATILIRMEDVTKDVLNGVTNKMTEKERTELIEKNIEKITKEAVKGTHYTAVIKPFYYGNQYFMYVNEVFK